MNYYVLEFSYGRDDVYDYKYKYFDNAEDALDFAHRVCYTNCGYDEMKHPESVCLIRIPDYDFLVFLNNPSGCDWPCMAQWFEVDAYVKKSVQ